MNNFIILGCARSGTSLMAGLLNNPAIYNGDNYIKPRISNPKGFFEDSKVNYINELILFNTYPKKYPFSPDSTFEEFKQSRWVSIVNLKSKVKSSEQFTKKIKSLLKNKPYCFKDPRFSYTLPVWRPYLKNVIYLCIFRHPSQTAESLVKEFNRYSPIKDKIKIDYNYALELWKTIYLHILEKHSKKGKWIFIHYEQLFDSDYLLKLSKKLKIQLDYSFPNKQFNRNKNIKKIPTDIQKIYTNLCVLSSHK